MTIVGNRLVIRAVSELDVQWLSALVNDDDVATPYYAELDLPRSTDDVREEFLAKRADYARFAVATHEGEMLGICGVAWGPPQYRYHRACRISLMLSRCRQGRGYGFETRVLLCDRLFAQLNVHRIVGGYLTSNASSARQAYRTGATICGTLREAWYFDGAFHDITAWYLSPDRFYENCGGDLRLMRAAQS